MIDIFRLNKSSDGNFIICIPENIYKLCKGTTGSFNVISSRLFGLTYAEYLRMCRDKYKAMLKGKQGYSIAVWKEEDKQYSKKLITELNHRWGIWRIQAKSKGLI